MPQKTADQCPKLQALASACHNGASNPAGIINSLSEAAKEIDPFEVRYHPAIKVIIGQLSYLMGESAGPSDQAIHEYQQWAGV